MVRVRLALVLLQKSRRWRARGISLIEVIVASVVMLLALTAVAPLYTMAVRDFGRATTSVDLQNQLDADFAAIRQLGEKLSWCSGSGSVNVTAVTSTCTSTTVGIPSYYVPASSSTNAELSKFREACNAGTSSSDPLTQPLVSAINALALPTGLTSRTVSLDDGPAHRLRIEYFQGSEEVGSLVYTPPLVAYCP